MVGGNGHENGPKEKFMFYVVRSLLMVRQPPFAALMSQSAIHPKEFMDQTPMRLTAVHPLEIALKGPGPLLHGLHGIFRATCHFHFHQL